MQILNLCRPSITVTVQKCLKEISKFWKCQAEAYNKRSDEGADMDSQDEHDHSV